MRYDFEYVLNSALDGIFIVDKNQHLVLFNRACEELYGVSREDVVNKACWKLAHLESFWKSVRNLNGKITYGELANNAERMVLHHKNGQQVWVETIYTPIYDQESGEIAYVMGVIKDITELKTIEEEKEGLQKELEKVRKELESKYDFSSIVGRSSKILHALKLAAQVASQNSTVMLSGESGTGKELIAKAIHYNSPRAAKSFVALNCSAFPDTLIESELFGYEKGAFTGAEKSKPGKALLANGGTLFLDEITEMSAPAQTKILRLLQEREFEPLGGIKSQRVDLRIIAATNKNLEQLVESGRFREDLYYRIYVYPIEIPPLRERREDIPVLVDYFIHKLNHEMGRKIEGITRKAMEILISYEWPGNVRELQNVIERLMILSKNNPVDVSDLPRYLSQEATAVKKPSDGVDLNSIPNGFSLENHIQRFESGVILDTLKKCGFNKTKAAESLGLTRSTLRYKLAKIPRAL